MTTEKDISDQVEAQEIKTTPAAENTTQPKQKSGDKVLAGVALLFSISALAGVGYGYITWQQSQLEAKQLSTQNSQLKQDVTALTQQVMDAQQSLLAYQTKQQAQFENAKRELQQQIGEQLNKANEQVVVKLSSEEVTNLYRMAEFKAVTEKDYVSAQAIFKRLDALLAQHAGTSAARQAIHQDMQTLNGLAIVPSEELYLTLHGLLNQVSGLTLNMVQLPEVKDQADSYALSEDIDDWQSNLKRSWQRLVDDFIKVRERTKAVEPLLSEREQALIKQQLRFYLSQAQQALMTEQAELFKVSLMQAEQALAEFFDGNQAAVVAMKQQLNLLKQHNLEFSPQFELVSKNALEELL